MLTLKKVAVTGGLACGKSSVCHIFRELGAYVVSADDIVHQLLHSNTPIGQRVINLLGPGIILDDKIDRGLIAEKVFNNRKSLTELEHILHPAVLDEIERQYQEIKTKGEHSLFIAEIPLLFEINAENQFDVTIAVDSEIDSCRKRFHDATGYDQQEFTKRMAMQLPIKEKNRRAQYVISNRSSLQEMHTTVVNLYNLLTRSSIPK